MKILILGGSGRVGRHLVEQSMNRGHSVAVLIRKRQDIPISNDQIRVFQGDALDAAAVDRVVSGRDAVLYALRADNLGDTRFYSDTTRILISAMQNHQVPRLVALTGVGAGNSKGHGGFLYDSLIFPFVTQKTFEDKDRQESMIRASGLDWVVVRPAMFFSDRRGGTIRATDTLSGVTRRWISRADTAKFMLDQLEKDTWLRKTPLIGY